MIYTNSKSGGRHTFLYTLIVVQPVIVCAKLKQSQLFEHGSIYGINDTLQIEVVHWTRMRGHLFME